MSAVDVFVRTSAILLAGLALRGLLGRRSPALRHWVLAATLLLAVLVMPLSVTVPAWTVEVPVAVRDEPAPVTGRAATAGAPRAASGSVIASPAVGIAQSATPVAPIVWSVGSAAGIMTLLAGLIRLRRLSHRGAPVTDPRWTDTARSIEAAYGLKRPVVLLQADAPFGLATWGLRPARVLLPPHAKDWTADRIHAVLCHELAHVARADWAVHIAARAARTALWFNPLAWLACRQLRRDSEQACDDAVLARGVRAADYAGHLVAVAREDRRQSWSSWVSWMPPALPMARRSAFERRIADMLNPKLDRRPVSRLALAGVTGLLAVVTLTTAALHAIQAPPAALAGTVYDQTGAVIPGVALTLEDAQQRSSKATTDAAGRFAFPGIGSGRYTLSAALPGFRTLRDEFDLTTASDWDRAVTLQLGTVSETISVSAGRLPSGTSAATASPSTPARVRVGGNIRVPKKTVDVHPQYPDSMRAAGREGQVPIEALIGVDGTVTSVRVVSAQVHPDFAIAAADAVRQWRFTPTLLNGQPVEVVMTVTVKFSLSD